MNVILAELKKIYKLKTLVVATFICIIYFFSFMHSWVDISGERLFGPPSLDEIARVLTQMYGPRLEPGDFESLQNYLEVLLAEQHYGLEHEHRIVIIKMAIDFYRANILHEYIPHLSHIVDIRLTSPFLNVNTHMHEHISGFRYSDELRNIMGSEVLKYTWQYSIRLAILSIIVNLLLVSPLIITDQTTKVHWLQYTSQLGRGIRVKQFVAMQISAIGTTTVLIAIFGGAFALNGTFIFWNNGINSFLGLSLHWLSIIYGQYILLIIGFIYILSMCVTAIAFIYSWSSSNIITLLFRLILLSIVTYYTVILVLRNFLVIGSGQGWTPQFLMLFATCLFIDFIFVGGTALKSAVSR